MASPLSQQRFERWRAELLDLSKRNRLIHFNPSVSPNTYAPQGIFLAQPDIDTLWNRVARLGKRQTFFDLEAEIAQLQSQSDDEESDQESESVLSPAPSRPLKTDEIRAEPGGKRLGRMLSNMRTRARTSFEEQGIVTLFVAFGFLKWADRGKTEGSWEERYSPLLLVPVELMRASPREPFTFKRLEEEVSLNPALQEKLTSDFKIKLPPPPSIDDKSIGDWLAEVDELVAAKHREWSVIDKAYLSLFSFHKIAMYKDLSENEDKFLSHPIVGNICGDRTPLDTSSSVVPELQELDSLPPEEIYLVTEADSTQHRAIVAARRGVSFVLQGPPGTGKSQTITNIIAECLENNRRVLFVSEKMAALDVVHGRLKRAGLGDFCLEAHSSKANKRAVVSELARTLRLNRFAAVNHNVDEAELETLRRDLNHYPQQIHLKDPQSNISIFEAVGNYANYLDAPDLEFSLDQPTAVSPTQRGAIQKWLEELCLLDSTFRLGTQHPWYGLHLPNSGLEARQIVFKQCHEAVGALESMEMQWPQLTALLGVWGAPTVSRIDKSLDFAGRLLDFRYGRHHARWIGGSSQSTSFTDQAEARRALAQMARSKTDGFRRASAEFEVNWDLTLLDADPLALKAALKGVSWWKVHVGASTGLGNAGLWQHRDLLLSQWSTGETSIPSLVNRILESSSLIAGEFGLEPHLAPTSVPFPDTLSQAVEIFKQGSLVLSLPHSNPSWWLGGLQEANAAAEEACLRFTTLSELEKRLTQSWRWQQLADEPGLLESLDSSYLTAVTPSLREDWQQVAELALNSQDTATSSETARLAIQTSNALARFLDIAPPQTVETASSLLAFSREIQNVPQLETGWLDAEHLTRVSETFERVRTDYGHLKEWEMSLAAEWEMEKLEALADVPTPERTDFGPSSQQKEKWGQLSLTAQPGEPTSTFLTPSGARAMTPFDAQQLRLELRILELSVPGLARTLNFKPTTNATENTDVSFDLENVARLVRLGHAVLNCPVPLPQWLNSSTAELIKDAALVRNDWHQWTALEREVKNCWKAEAGVSVDAQWVDLLKGKWPSQFIEISAENLVQVKNSWRNFFLAAGVADGPSGEPAALAKGSNLTMAGNSWLEVSRLGTEIAESLGQGAPENLQECFDLQRLAQACLEGNPLQPNWFESGVIPILLRRLDALHQEHREIEELRAQAAKRWNLTVLETLPFQEMQERFEGKYQKFLGKLGGNFKADCSALTTALQPGATLDLTAVPSELRVAAAWRQKRDAARQNQESNLHDFGDPFAGGETDWDALKAQLQRAQRLLDSQSGTPSAQLVALVGSSGTVDRANLERLLSRLAAQLRELARVTLSLEVPAQKAFMPLPQAPFACLQAWTQLRLCLAVADDFEPRQTAQDLERLLTFQSQQEIHGARMDRARSVFGHYLENETADFDALDRHLQLLAAAQSAGLGLLSPQMQGRIILERSADGELLATLPKIESALEAAAFQLLNAAQEMNDVGEIPLPSASPVTLKWWMSSRETRHDKEGWNFVGGIAALDHSSKTKTLRNSLRDEAATTAFALGSSFTGENTVWADFSAALESARRINRFHIGSEVITTLLTSPPAQRSPLIPLIRDNETALGQLGSSWVRHLDAVLTQNKLGESSTLRTPFSQLECEEKWRAASLNPTSLQASGIAQAQSDLSQRAELLQNIGERLDFYRENLGDAFEAEKTNWEDLKRTLETVAALTAKWGDAMPLLLRTKLTENAWNTDSMARFEMSENVNRLNDALRALQKALEALRPCCPLSPPPFGNGASPLAQTSLQTWKQWNEEQAPALARYFAVHETLQRFAKDQSPQSSAVVPDDETLSDALDLGEKLRVERAEILRDGVQWQQEFSDLYDGLLTDWEAIEAANGEFEQLLAGADPGAVETLGLLWADPQQSTQNLDRLREELSILAEGRAAFEVALKMALVRFPEAKIGEDRLRDAPLLSLRHWFNAKNEASDELDNWLRLQNLISRSVVLGLKNPLGGDFQNAKQADFLSCLMEQTPQSEDVVPAFWKRFWALFLDQATQNSVWRDWSGASHERDIERFAALDEAMQIASRDALRAQLSRDKPAVNIALAGVGDIAVLLREAEKRSRHKPLRQLFGEIPNLVQKLKPCMLMSPLSVAQFLPLNSVKFDIVVFDEASQICPEDALGAIGRGAQLIVVGDNKQLPPTRLFATSDSEDDIQEDEEDFDGSVDSVQGLGTGSTGTPGSPRPAPIVDDLGKVESILDECSTSGMGQMSLLWHYRSRHEELIAFSNAHFYDHNLQTFPGPHAPNAALGLGRAISWEKVEGYYRPSGKGAGREGGTNRIEAKRVAQLAVEHARTCPQESLGIITFSEPQRRAVEEEVNRLLAYDRSLDSFFNATGENAFFIKALENVQGDERDAIFFSVGFGPRRDKEGEIKPMLMNFGPLNKEGGERRLNVAVTRAKAKIKVVTSFEPDEIRVERLRSRGGKLLRSYIEFARSGNSELIGREQGGDKVVPMGEVAKRISLELEKEGWKTHLNVGLGEYRVDVGVENPDRPGELLLGVCCDGAHYSNAATARDRDRLRPFVLQRLGWKLVAVWSPDFAYNPKRDIKRILIELGKAREELVMREQERELLLSQSFANHLAIEPVQEDFAQTFLGNSAQIDSDLYSPLQSFGQDSAKRLDDQMPDDHDADEYAANEESDSEFGLEESGSVGEAGSENNLFWGAPYQPVELNVRGNDVDFDALAHSNSPLLREALLEIVNGEGPVSHLEATRRLIAGWNMKRAGTRLQAIVSALAMKAQKEGLMQIRNEGGLQWYWPSEMTVPTPRPPLDEWSVRAPAEICLEEITEGAAQVVQSAYSIGPEELLNQTAREFGYKQTGRLVRERFVRAIKLLEHDPRIVIDNAQFVWNDAISE